PSTPLAPGSSRPPYGGRAEWKDQPMSDARAFIDRPASASSGTGARAEAAPAPTVTTPPAPEPPPAPKRPPSTRVPSIIVGVVIAAVAALSIWYLVRPQPLLVQGEADATRFDIAARVDGRVSEIPVVRGQDVAAGAVLVRIDNPETIAKNEQALAAK